MTTIPNQHQHQDPGSRPRLHRRTLVSAAAGLILAPLMPARQALAQEAQAPVEGAVGEIPGAGTAYFAETGHNLAEPFRSRWEQAGGTLVLGAPLSEERWATGAGGVLQTFEKITLLYDPGAEAPFDVRGQRLDKTRWLELAPRSAFAKVAGCPGAGCFFVEETGHTVSGAIAAFWQERGGEALFGNPLTEPYLDDAAPGALRIQLFENGVLEEYPDGVRLRPLGRQLAEDGGLMEDPAFKPAPPTGGDSFLVNASDGLRLRAAPSPDAVEVALLADNAEFVAARDGAGEWVAGYADGSSGYVAASFLRERPPLPQLDPADWNPAIWQGAALGETNVRAEPTTASRIVETLDYGKALAVAAWVKGEEVFEGADLWAKLDDARFVYARNVGRTAPVQPLPPPPEAPAFGRWIDINLTQQLMTAYDGPVALRTVPVTTGMAGWETPPGLFSILNRVANETMTSGAIGAENHYRLEDVLFTQYFTDRGHAIHFAWWRTKETIGRPGSHGCINILLEDARFFWDFADYGTPVLTHY
ncbi:MAG: hypothetical protein AVDCRST_MAG59-1188 [uncultured Thermomicrobiales bacterium]|uniref:L,D-TPase catalytic domain-containing protein n=1 Tax=uncultured Thermomicrobiales bacterium TaxID=1645740 RepID=A0A6J4UDQ1_9BACT|nr:MAG: hypothetical protein AVDCRST_MAG59-1188 [uncultured Thermomicrobiales bacterium]